MEFQKAISFKTVGFGFLSIVTILVVSYLHFVEIKRVLRNIKIIWLLMEIVMLTNLWVEKKKCMWKDQWLDLTIEMKNKVYDVIRYWINSASPFNSILDKVVSAHHIHHSTILIIIIILINNLYDNYTSIALKMNKI